MDEQQIIGFGKSTKHSDVRNDEALKKPQVNYPITIIVTGIPYFFVGMTTRLISDRLSFNDHYKDMI